jgi:hypothetical protein
MRVYENLLRILPVIAEDPLKYSVDISNYLLYCCINDPEIKNYHFYFKINNRRYKFELRKNIIYYCCDFQSEGFVREELTDIEAVEIFRLILHLKEAITKADNDDLDRLFIDTDQNLDIE